MSRSTPGSLVSTGTPSMPVDKHLLTSLVCVKRTIHRTLMSTLIAMGTQRNGYSLQTQHSSQSWIISRSSRARVTSTATSGHLPASHCLVLGMHMPRRVTEAHIQPGECSHTTCTLQCTPFIHGRPRCGRKRTGMSAQATGEGDWCGPGGSGRLRV